MATRCDANLRIEKLYYIDQFMFLNNTIGYYYLKFVMHGKRISWINMNDLSEMQR